MANYSGETVPVPSYSSGVPSAAGIDAKPSTPAVVPISPVVTVLEPTPGTVITPTTKIVMQVTTTGTFRRILVKIVFPGAQVWELAYDGDAFAPKYTAQSSRMETIGGFQFTLLRDPVWPDSPSVEVFAFDQSGGEA